LRLRLVKAVTVVNDITISGTKAPEKTIPEVEAL
jgi:hypothetical protein